jgi:hypothetical protein
MEGQLKPLPPHALRPAASPTKNARTEAKPRGEVGLAEPRSIVVVGPPILPRPLLAIHHLQKARPRVNDPCLKNWSLVQLKKRLLGDANWTLLQQKKWTLLQQNKDCLGTRIGCLFNKNKLLGDALR